MTARWGAWIAGPTLVALMAGLSHVAVAAPVGPGALPGRWAIPVLVNDDGRSAEQRAPAVTRDGLGGLHAVWVDGRDGGQRGAIYYSYRAPEGVVWGPNTRVAGPDDATARLDPAIAVDSIGRVHVTWTEFRDGDPDIYHSALAAGARTWSLPRRVNDDAGAAIQWHPAMAVDLWGTTHIAWTDYRSGTADIYYTRVLADDWWAPNVRVNEPAAGDQQHVRLAGARSGDIHAVWQDTRDGPSNVYASRLPPGGGTWWPNARLSRSTGPARQFAPAVAADGDGAVQAVWIDAGAGGQPALRMATLRPDQPYWEPDRVLYQPTNGAPLSTALAGGPGSLLVAWWTESRPSGTRVYSGVVQPDGTLLAERVDGSPMVTDGAEPVGVVDDLGWATVLWRGVPAEAAHGEVYAATAQLAAPSFEPVTLTGRLQYRTGVDQCTGEGWVVVSCDGLPSPMILSPAHLSLLPFLGTHVVLSGRFVASGTCPRVVADAVRLESSKCPTEAGGVTGLVTVDDTPVAGATVFMGAEAAATGASGRFFLDLIPPGAHVLTVTAPCALVLSAGPVSVRPRAVTDLGPGRLIRGDVVPNCAIDLADLVAVASQYKALPPFFPACTDLDADGAVTLYDLVAVATHYDRTCPTTWSGASDGRRTDRAAGAPGTGTAVAPSPPATEPQPRVVAAAPAPAPLPMRPGDVVVRLRGRAPVAGWSLALPFDPERTAVWDQDTAVPGVQPFRVPPGRAPAWVVENEVDPSGWLRLTVALLGDGPTVADGEALAIVHVTGATVGRALPAAVTLAGPGGTRAVGDIALAVVAGTEPQPGAARRPAAPAEGAAR